MFSNKKIYTLLFTCTKKSAFIKLYKKTTISRSYCIKEGRQLGQEIKTFLV